MIESLSTNIQDFIRNVRIVDFLDVALIAVTLYLLLNWLRRSLSRRSIISILLLLFLYVFARFTEMYLTEILIEGLFILILIGAVVVFQSDIRRLIDQIGNWGMFWKNHSSGSGSISTDIITEAAAKMAENKTGALILIKGEEDWDRHINGGVELDGKLSLPLLLSIFNPKTPGHDGAVLLEDGRITRFSAHLPLSTQLHKISKGGTRHAAALGISEQCDALVIVVSEERGVISVAQSGRITELESGSELKSYLDAFWKEHYEAQEAGLRQWWRKRSPGTAFVSVAIAVFFWFAFVYNSETVYRTFLVPIEYRNLQSANIVLEDPVPIRAQITLSGSEQAFQLFDPSELVVSFNLGSKQSTDTTGLVITEQHINLPSDLNLYEVTPQSLEVKIRRLVKTEVPVRIPVQGELPPQLELVAVTSEPRSVTILTPQNEVPDSLAVKPVDLSGITGSKKVTKDLVLPSGAKIPEGSAGQVTVSVRVRKRNT